MKKFATIATIAILASAIAAAVPAAAFAEDAAAATVQATRGAMLYSADGKRLGNVYRVTAQGDAQLIYRGRLITVAVSTLSQANGKLSTSLSQADVNALR